MQKLAKAVHMTEPYSTICVKEGIKLQYIVHHGSYLATEPADNCN